MSIFLYLITEDSLSETVARKMLKSIDRDYEIVTVFTWNKDAIRRRIKDINRAARGFVYFILTDQDTEDRCPPDAIKEIGEPKHGNLLYRFAVMETESWVLAHREAVSRFLSLSVDRIPVQTDTILNPKEFLVSLVRRYGSGEAKRDIVPRRNSTSRVGPNYNGKLNEFVLKHWDVRVAAQSSGSLKRTFDRLREFEPEWVSE